MISTRNLLEQTLNPTSSIWRAPRGMSHLVSNSNVWKKLANNRVNHSRRMYQRPKTELQDRKPFRMLHHHVYIPDSVQKVLKLQVAILPSLETAKSVNRHQNYLSRTDWLRQSRKARYDSNNMSSKTWVEKSSTPMIILDRDPSLWHRKRSLVSLIWRSLRTTRHEDRAICRETRVWSRLVFHPVIKQCAESHRWEGTTLTRDRK